MSGQGQGQSTEVPFPHRIFLDTGVVQYFFDYGEFIFDGGPLAAADRIHGIPGGVRDLEALVLLYRVNQRNAFELAVSKNSLREVVRRRQPPYTDWLFELAAYWHEALGSYGGKPFGKRGRAMAEKLAEASGFGYLSGADKTLLGDACLFECDAFLTVDRRLARNADHLKRQLGLRVLTPAEFDDLISPWAALF